MAGVPRSTGHRQKVLKDMDGRRVLVDEDLAPIVRACVELGIRTVGSCQQTCSHVCHRRHRLIRAFVDPSIRKRSKDDSQLVHVYGYCRDRCWLVFETAADAEGFLNAVAVHGDPDYDRMQGVGCTGGRRRSAWSWRMCVENWGEEPVGRDRYGCVKERFNGRNQFNMQVQFSMSRRDIALVTERLEAAVLKRRARRRAPAA